MAKRRIEIEVSGTVTIEVDDDATSTAYEGETIRTAHLNPERFIQDEDHERNALMSLAEYVGIDGRDIDRVDGWADFPRGAVRQHGWPRWHYESHSETVVE